MASTKSAISHDSPTESIKTIALQTYSNKNYNKNQKRGYAVIINNINFSTRPHVLPDRQGATVDQDQLAELWNLLDFDVYKYVDKTCSEIIEILNDVSTKWDHSKADCFVLCAMSHGGSDGSIEAKDGSYSVTNLWNSFTTDNCPQLAGKPKMFFVQSCKGTMEMTYSSVPTDADCDRHGMVQIPVMADFLIMFATLEGYLSYLTPKDGSVFMKSLVAYMRTYFKTTDIVSILTQVNRQISIDQIFITSQASQEDAPDNKLQNVKQMSQIISSLTRKINFFEDSDEAYSSVQPL